MAQAHGVNEYTYVCFEVLSQTCSLDTVIIPVNGGSGDYNSESGKNDSGALQEKIMSTSAEQRTRQI